MHTTRNSSIVVLLLLIAGTALGVVGVVIVERPRPSGAAPSPIVGWTNSVLRYEFTDETACGNGNYEDTSYVGSNYGTQSVGAAIATWTNDGVRGPSLIFDGIDDYIAMGVGDLGFATTDDFTICGWFKTLASNENQRIISMGNGEVSSSPQVFIRVGTDEKAHVFARGKDTDNTGYRKGTANVVDGNWHHILGIIKGSTDTVELYVDGLGDGSESGVWTATNLTNTVIGNLYPELNQEMDGGLDDPRIYDRALTTGEIYQIFLGD